MRRLTGIPLMLAALAGCSHHAPPARAALATFSPVELRADAARLRSVLLEGHPSLRKYRSAAEVDSILRALDDSTREPRTAIDFWRLTSIAVAGIRDDHTSIVPNSAVFDAVYTNPGAALPLRLGIIDRRLFILSNYLGADGPPEGSEILAVNGAPTGLFLDRCASVVPTDGRVALRALRKVERDFELTCALVHGLPAEYRLALRTPAGDSVTSTVRAVPWKERRRLVRATVPRDTIRPEDGNLRFDDSSVATLTIHTWSKGDSFDPDKFIRRSFERIRASGARRLIIDLRGNTGGSDGPAATLYRNIARDTFTYYTHRVVNKRRFDLLKGTDDWMLNYVFWFKPIRRQPDGRYQLQFAMDKVMKPEKAAFTGAVFLLIDGNSVSTSSEFASLFRAKDRGIVIGEESGSALGGGSGATVSVVLPNTQLILNIPLMAADIAPRAGSTESLDRGVMPDVPIARTLSDLLSGRDAALARALELARGSPP